ncbi:hypothetical protein PROH_04575 [Prochlorothrix hollandica PCC 9006 = CALU 1027]|uniref:Uncharacterized protein n=1 Tax=Prochlorothrix hollandica PCC 9006 = CALU 1027 TaxID=317619 RepID=A0A0M2Q4R1_PROHO|nr:hypothetical protein PROH_04575 [Prochlorothrix hollandica PCC 9006 = CALU 1027]
MICQLFKLFDIFFNLINISRNTAHRWHYKYIFAVFYWRILHILRGEFDNNNASIVFNSNYCFPMIQA